MKKRIVILLLLLVFIVTGSNACSQSQDVPNEATELSPVSTSPPQNVAQPAEPNQGQVPAQPRPDQLLSQPNPLASNFGMEYELTSENIETVQDAKQFIYSGTALPLTLALNVSGFTSVGFMVLVDGYFQAIEFANPAEVEVERYQSLGEPNPYMLKINFSANQQEQVLRKIPFLVDLQGGKAGELKQLTLLLIIEPDGLPVGSQRRGSGFANNMHSLSHMLRYESDAPEVQLRGNSVYLKQVEENELDLSPEIMNYFLDTEGNSQLDLALNAWLTYPKEDLARLYTIAGKPSRIPLADIEAVADLPSSGGLALLDTKENPSTKSYLHLAGPPGLKVRAYYMVDHLPLLLETSELGKEYTLQKNREWQLGGDFSWEGLSQAAVFYALAVPTNNVELGVFASLVSTVKTVLEPVQGQ